MYVMNERSKLASLNLSAIHIVKAPTTTQQILFGDVKLLNE